MKVKVFDLGNKFEKFGFAFSVNNFAHIVASEFAVNDFKFVGVHKIEVELLFEIVAKIVETAGEDGDFVAVLFKNFESAFCAFGDRKIFGNLFHHAFVQAFE